MCRILFADLISMVVVRTHSCSLMRCAWTWAQRLYTHKHTHYTRCDAFYRLYTCLHVAHSQQKSQGKRSIVLSLFLACALTHTQQTSTYKNMHTHTCTHTYTHTHVTRVPTGGSESTKEARKRAMSHSLSLMHTNTHTQALSLSHTHAQTHKHTHTHTTLVPTGGSESAREARKRKMSSPFSGSRGGGGDERSFNHQQDKPVQVCLYLCVHLVNIVWTDWDGCNVWGRHVTCMNESCHVYKWVMSHVWMSHGTDLSESCDMYDWFHM